MSRDGEREETRTVSILTRRARIARHRERTAITRPRLGLRGEAWANQVSRRHAAPSAGSFLARHVASRYGPLTRRLWEPPPLLFMAGLGSWRERRDEVAAPRTPQEVAGGTGRAGIAGVGALAPIREEAAPGPAPVISGTPLAIQRYRSPDGGGLPSVAGPATQRGGPVPLRPIGPGPAGQDSVAMPLGEGAPPSLTPRWDPPGPLAVRSAAAGEHAPRLDQARPGPSHAERPSGNGVAGERRAGAEPRAAPPPLALTVGRHPLVTRSGAGAGPSLPGPAGPMAAPLWEVVARHGLPYLVHRPDMRTGMPLFAGGWQEHPLTIPQEHEQGASARLLPRLLTTRVAGDPVRVADASEQALGMRTSVPAHYEGSPPRVHSWQGAAQNRVLPAAGAPAAGEAQGAVSLVWQAPAGEPRREQREEAPAERLPAPARDVVTASLQAEAGRPRPEADGERGPSLSVPAVAEQVYRLLERRLVIERERRGIF